MRIRSTAACLVAGLLCMGVVRGQGFSVLAEGEEAPPCSGPDRGSAVPISSISPSGCLCEAGFSGPICQYSYEGDGDDDTNGQTQVTFSDIGAGNCKDSAGRWPSYLVRFGLATTADCEAECAAMPTCLGFNYRSGNPPGGGCGCNCRWWFLDGADLQTSIDALEINFTCSSACNSVGGVDRESGYYRRNTGAINGTGISHGNGNSGDGRCVVVSSRLTQAPTTDAPTNPTTEPPPQSSNDGGEDNGDNLTMIIGGAVMGVVILVIAIVIIRQCAQRQPLPPVVPPVNNEPEYATMNYDEMGHVVPARRRLDENDYVVDSNQVGGQPNALYMEPTPVGTHA